jgi:polyhydroxyalkanoate synthesis regulator phasin
MKNIIKKSVLFGLGIGALTKEKAEKFAKDMQKKGYLNAKEGKKLAKDMIAESVKTQKKVQAMVDTNVKKALKAMPLATKKDLKDLEKRLKKK